MLIKAAKKLFHSKIMPNMDEFCDMIEKVAQDVLEEEQKAWDEMPDRLRDALLERGFKRPEKWW